MASWATGQSSTTGSGWAQDQDSPQQQGMFGGAGQVAPPTAAQQGKPAAAGGVAYASGPAGGSGGSPVNDDGTINPGYAGGNTNGQVSNWASYSNHPAYQYVVRAYQQYLGRVPSPEEVMSHLGWGQNMDAAAMSHAWQQIQHSAEAAAYAASQAAKPAVTPTVKPVVKPAAAAAAKPAASTAAPGASIKIPSLASFGGPPPAPSFDVNSLNAFASLAPNQQGYNDQLLQALSQALGQSEWSPERIAAQKEVQKEQTFGMRDQLAQQLGGRYAGLGRSGSGAETSGLRDLDEAAVSQALGGYRDIEENAANARRQELLATAGALNTALGGQMERWLAPYNLALQKELGEGSLGLDWAQLGESARMGNLELLLAWNQLREQARQADNGMGYNWAALNLGGLGL